MSKSEATGASYTMVMRQLRDRYEDCASILKYYLQRFLSLGHTTEDSPSVYELLDRVHGAENFLKARVYLCAKLFDAVGCFILLEHLPSSIRASWNLLDCEDFNFSDYASLWKTALERPLQTCLFPRMRLLFPALQWLNLCLPPECWRYHGATRMLHSATSGTFLPLTLADTASVVASRRFTRCTCARTTKSWTQCKDYISFAHMVDMKTVWCWGTGTRSATPAVVLCAGRATYIAS